MLDTSKSLLQRLHDGDESAWGRFVELYQPMIRGWLLRQEVRPQDAEDLTQDILAILVKELPNFTHREHVGSFRGWLRTISVNRARAFWRAGKCRPSGAPGDSNFLQALEQLEDPNSDITAYWNEQHDDYVLQRLLAIVEEEFESQTVTAFRLLTLDQKSSQDVAHELDMTVAAVYGAKSRVLQRLRQEAEGLLDI